MGEGTFVQLLRLLISWPEKNEDIRIGEGWLKVPAAPHAYAPKRYWAPYRGAPMGIVYERRIVVVLEESKEKTRSTLYILGTRPRGRTSMSINGTDVHRP